MSRLGSVAETVTNNSGIIVATMVLLTAFFGVGMGMVEQSSYTGFSSEREVSKAYDEVRSDFSTREANTTITMVAVRNESGNALSKASLVRTLRYQQALRENETLNETLVETASVANVVARAAVAAERKRDLPAPVISGWEGAEQADVNATAETVGDPDPPSVDEQIAQLESMNDSEVSEVVDYMMAPGNESAASRVAYRLLPREYDPGATDSDSHLLLIVQETEGEAQTDIELSESVVSGQQAARSLAKDRPGSETYSVFSGGLMKGQESKAISDSLSILGPLALLLVLVALSVAYRDPVDIALGLVGVVVVLVWTMGSMGWLGIEFSQTMIAVPILLTGLSVDYALHVVMRYRDERERRGEGARDAGGRDAGARDAMARSLTSVGPALVLVTVTTAIGFLANLTSSMVDIRMFGVASAIGIVATLCVFGLFLPALKITITSLSDRVGWTRTPSAVGSVGSVRRVIGRGVSLADAPIATLMVVLLLTTTAAYGASQIDVATPQTAFMADDPPEWTEDLPEQVRPGEYYLKTNREYIYSNFQSPDKQGYVLVEGNVTAPGTLDRVVAAASAANESEIVLDDPSGDAAVTTPVSAMRQAAEENETFNATFRAADTDGDGVPDRNVEALYDEFYVATPNLATQTLHRTDDGEYTGLVLRMAVDGTVDRGTAVKPLERAEAELDDARGVEAIATGQPAVLNQVYAGLATTVIESLTLTLLVILGLLMVIFRAKEGSASLGVVTLVPIAFSVTWLFGTMTVLDIPISLTTALVGSISVGLGVDYAIHVSERFAEEWDGGDETEAALKRTVNGTGSTLLSSAATTAGGFGVLAFALLPALRQFGLILAIGIVYSFLSTVYVQPSLLELWARYGVDSGAPTEG